MLTLFNQALVQQIKMQAIGGSITPARKKHGRTLIESEEDLAKKYPSNCSFYLDPPTESITLQKFEDYAVARLHGKTIL